MQKLENNNSNNINQTCIAS